MTKKFKLNKETLKGLFDYNTFSPSTKLEEITKQSLSRLEKLSAPADSEKDLDFISFDTLEQLSAAGKTDQEDLPPEIKNL